ncbi:MAG: hypothetical protein K2N67_05010 [Mucispirillum sp.]|nr:hypothetical protein [Mucispirillum sp.]
MNYSLLLSGFRFAAYDECIKLLLYSAAQSDYIIETEGFAGISPYSPKKNRIYLTGSSKKIYRDIFIDFDGTISGMDTNNNIALSPDILDINAKPDALHYWAMTGAIFKIIGDLSPAYVTGYLLERSRKKELEAFNSFLSRLPFAVQVAVNELMTDMD